MRIYSERGEAAPGPGVRRRGKFVLHGTAANVRTSTAGGLVGSRRARRRVRPEAPVRRSAEQLVYKLARAAQVPIRLRRAATRRERAASRPSESSDDCTSLRPNSLKF